VSVSSFASFSPKPFKYFNFWADHNKFLDWIGYAWRMEVDGYSMF
jgi:hypothetical protein